MLVYGDPQFTARVGCLRRHLQSLLEVPPAPAGFTVDFWRKILVQAGQLEQGIADLARESGLPRAVSHAERVTDLAAEKFFQAWSQRAPGGASDVLQALDLLQDADGQELRIK